MSHTSLLESPTDAPSVLDTLTVSERMIVDQLFVLSNEAPVTVALNPLLHEHVNAVTVDTREELAIAILKFKPEKRSLVVQRLGGMVLEQLQKMFDR